MDLLKKYFLKIIVHSIFFLIFDKDTIDILSDSLLR